MVHPHKLDFPVDFLRIEMEQTENWYFSELDTIELHGSKLKPHDWQFHTLNNQELKTSSPEPGLDT